MQSEGQDDPSTKFGRISSTKRILLTACGVIVLLVMIGFPILIRDHVYGEMSVPGSAVVRLPAGDVDVTMFVTESAERPPMPPLTLGISGPAGSSTPEVIESPRTTFIDSRERLWVLRVVQEADYRIEVDGEVHDPYQPSLIFGKFVWNSAVSTLLLIDLLVVSQVVGGLVLMTAIVWSLAGGCWIFAKLRALMARLGGRSPSPEIL